MAKLHARHVAALREAHLAGKRLGPVEIEALLNTAEYWIKEGRKQERARIVADLSGYGDAWVSKVVAHRVEIDNHDAIMPPENAAATAGWKDGGGNDAL